uniref:AlNc14C632G12301 protein n=1 Tax=Albugo laibachii Nc14 TaxID=890382 RepID=F0X1J8_9STRA|nr:AlNc14C632G12301 [Albugo laibachii Nc14]|eukprot:CCA27688.1 AlNc14C632G12301 [Albugo laibachii Nc14]
MERIPCPENALESFQALFRDTKVIIEVVGNCEESNVKPNMDRQICASGSCIHQRKLHGTHKSNQMKNQLRRKEKEVALWKLRYQLKRQKESPKADINIQRSQREHLIKWWSKRAIAKVQNDTLKQSFRTWRQSHHVNQTELPQSRNKVQEALRTTRMFADSFGSFQREIQANIFAFSECINKLANVSKAKVSYQC